MKPEQFEIDRRRREVAKLKAERITSSIMPERLATSSSTTAMPVAV